MRKNRLTEEQVDGWWDIARAGRWKGTVAGNPAEIEISTHDLEDMAADYDRLLQEAPVTLEHKKEGPAHGWVSALRVAGDRLQAKFTDLSAKLRQWLGSGAYRSRSIEMYKPFEPTGKAYLGAVSFLGAAPPAVKGLSPEPCLLARSEQGPRVRIEHHSIAFKEDPMKGEAQMDDKTIAERVIHALKEVFRGSGAENAWEGKEKDAPDKCAETQPGARVAELEETLEREKTARREAEARLAEMEEKLAEKIIRTELAQFSEKLDNAASEARITPAELEGYLKLGSRLDSTGRKAILEEIEARQPGNLFSELSAPRGKDTGAGELASTRAGFDSFPEDPEHDAALALMDRKPGLSFAEALKRVRMDGANKG
ncbi:MAG: hypothetical protein U9N45_03660 [Gemmatimonadota bacterium]|nr:hypothetical protein [Gemmatimonadota bacterium]